VYPIASYCLYILYYYCTIVYRLYLLLFSDCCFPRDHDHGIYCKVHRHGFGGVFRIAKYRPEHAFASRSQYSCGSIQIVHPAGQRFFERWCHCGKTTDKLYDYLTSMTLHYYRMTILPIEGLAITTGSCG